MVINTDNLVSITEANQNFSRVARMVDENGAAVILKNNVCLLYTSRLAFTVLALETEDKANEHSCQQRPVVHSILKQPFSPRRF